MARGKKCRVSGSRRTCFCQACAAKRRRAAAKRLAKRKPPVNLETSRAARREAAAKARRARRADGDIMNTGIVYGYRPGYWQ